MTDLGTVVLLAALPAAGNFAGGLIAEVVDVSRAVVSLALHAALGIILAVVSLEPLPQAFTIDAKWVPIAAFALGGATFAALDTLLHRVERRLSGSGGTGPWAVFLATSVDLFTDGLMIGTGAVVSVTLALLLALGQVSADIPEGFATMAGFKAEGVERRRRLLIASAFIVPIMTGALLGYFAVRGASETVQLSLLAFTAGILLAVAVEEVGPQAERCEPRQATLALIGGFTLFALVSAYVEA